GIGDLSNFPGLDDGVDARFERANDAGGVRGHRLVNDGVSDAGADAARAQTIAGQYAGQGKVLAVLPVASVGFSTAASSALDGAAMPCFGWGFRPGFCDGNEWGFGVNGCVQSTSSAVSSNQDPLLDYASEQLGIPVSELRVAGQF